MFITWHPLSHLVIPPVALPELRYQSLHDELPRLRKLGVNDSDEGSIDVGEHWRGRLSLDDGASQETTPPNHILLEELADNVTNVCNIHLNGTING